MWGDGILKPLGHWVIDFDLESSVESESFYKMFRGEKKALGFELQITNIRLSAGLTKKQWINFSSDGLTKRRQFELFMWLNKKKCFW